MFNPPPIADLIWSSFNRKNGNPSGSWAPVRLKKKTYMHALIHWCRLTDLAYWLYSLIISDEIITILCLAITSSGGCLDPQTHISWGFLAFRGSKNTDPLSRVFRLFWEDYGIWLLTWAISDQCVKTKYINFTHFSYPKNPDPSEVAIL